MANYRIIYEKGVEIRRQSDGHWCYHSAHGEYSPLKKISPTDIRALGIRPIVLEAVADSRHGTALLLPSEEGIDDILMSEGPAFFTLPPDHWFDMQINDLFHKMIEVEIKITTAEKVAYTLRSVSHHCQRLAEDYSRINEDFTAIRPFSEGEADKMLFSANYSPWFEFDALVTAVRRAYDSTKDILWYNFGNKVDCPSSFYKTYPKCDQLPNSLGEKLDSSWKDYGLKVTSYRNNVQHYANMDFGMASVEMVKLNNSVWGSKVLLPDNPEVKARDKFLYKEGVDALTYGWQIACEVLDVSSAIIAAVEKQRVS